MNDSWLAVCHLHDIAPNTGICAKVHDKQVAIFRQGKGQDLYAIDNFDPIGKANVLSRGLLAHIGDSITVASPLYKQHYCLQSGICKEDEKVKIPVYKVRLNEGAVEVLAG
ncbi:Nitrite reductase (NADH) small subunit [Thalassocella blandensis]|nr:Nitrite reductase (NADH) small subunit [Thalassocella blandensis]